MFRGFIDFISIAPATSTGKFSFIKTLTKLVVWFLNCSFEVVAMSTCRSVVRNDQVFATCSVLDSWIVRRKS